MIEQFDATEWQDITTAVKQYAQVVGARKTSMGRSRHAARLEGLADRMAALGRGDSPKYGRVSIGVGAFPNPRPHLERSGMIDGGVRGR